MARSYIAIENLSKSFGAFAAVSDISLAIGQGEFFSLLGPSGCGKSTLLRMIAGFESPSDGKVWLDGADVTDLPAHRRPTNMMFQSYALFPHLNVGRNIAFGLVEDRLPRAEIAARVSEVADKLQLTPLLERKPGQLSGGQKQRVALARALVKRPKVLLLDEPLGALDKNLRTETQHELVRLQKELGLTFIIVTHDQHEAMTVSSRVAIMGSGKVLQVGSPREVYETPVSRYVAKFLGEANILDVVRVERQGSELRVETAQAEEPIVMPVREGLPTEGPFWLSVRPERVTLSGTGSGVRGVVEDISYTGVQCSYRLRLPRGGILDAVRINQGAADDIAVGDTVSATWAPASAHVLTA